MLWNVVNIRIPRLLRDAEQTVIRSATQEPCGNSTEHCPHEGRILQRR